MSRNLVLSIIFLKGLVALFLWSLIMANDFLSFMGGIGSTPTPVYGTSAEDAARRAAISSGANYWNSTTPAQTGYMPAADGPTYQTPGNMYSPSYAGTGAANPVRTTSVGPIDRGTAANNYYGQAVTYFPSSGRRSISDLLSGVGSYTGPESLSQPPAQAASKGGYAPWGALSRSLAYNAFNTPASPAPAAPNVPLPRPRPEYAPNTWNRMDVAGPPPVGANPGMGGALLGNGVMNPGIPPQQPPADGSSPLPVWAGDAPAAPGAPAAGGYQVPGTPRPLSGAERYSLANLFGQQAAQQRQAQATGTAGGYQYVNGTRAGYAPQTIGGSTYTPMNGASAYGLANAAGQIAALNRQAAATGNTGVYNYVNGIKTGTVNGQSSANAYAAANAGPGSVSTFEQKASGRPAGSYSDGREPSGTGSLW